MLVVSVAFTLKPARTGRTAMHFCTSVGRAPPATGKAAAVVKLLGASLIDFTWVTQACTGQQEPTARDKMFDARRHGLPLYAAGLRHDLAAEFELWNTACVTFVTSPSLPSERGGPDTRSRILP